MYLPNAHAKANLASASVLLWALASLACSSSKSPPSVPVDSGEPTDMDAMSMDGGMPVSCANDVRVATYSDGLIKLGQSQKAEVRFVAAHPSPPARGDNGWDIQVLDGSGNSLDANVSLALDMPDHGHTSPTTPVIVAGAASGTFTITSINLFMPGVWRAQLTLNSKTDAGGSGTLIDAVTVLFCIEG